jgi:hypothetical protein
VSSGPLWRDVSGRRRGKRVGGSEGYHSGEASVLSGATKGGRDSSGGFHVCHGYGGDPLKGATVTGPLRAFECVCEVAVVLVVAHERGEGEGRTAARARRRALACPGLCPCALWQGTGRPGHDLGTSGLANIVHFSGHGGYRHAW